MDTDHKPVSSNLPRRLFVLLFRKHAGEPWVEIDRGPDAEALWLRSLEYRANGCYLEREVTPDMFGQHAAEPAQ